MRHMPKGLLITEENSQYVLCRKQTPKDCPQGELLSLYPSQRVKERTPNPKGRLISFKGDLPSVSGGNNLICGLKGIKMYLATRQQSMTPSLPIHICNA